MELRRSLKTTFCNDAKALVRAELFRAERLFVQLRGGSMKVSPTLQTASSIVPGSRWILKGNLA